MTNTIDDFCARILTLDDRIRFAGIANDEGNLVGHARRKGLVPLLNSKETKMMLLQSVIRMGTRTTIENKMGETMYAFAMYKKVKRATIPIRKASKITHILLVSFDVEADHDSIILNKILPEAQKLVL